MDGIPAWVALLVSLGVGLLVALLVQLFVVPWQRRKVLGQSKASKKPVKFTIDGGEGELLTNALRTCCLHIRPSRPQYHQTSPRRAVPPNASRPPNRPRGPHP